MDSFAGTSMINNAEITSASNALDQVDTDGPLSIIDGASDDDSELGTDNDIDDEMEGTPGTADNPADVDDYDPAEIEVVLIHDVALRKVVSSEPGQASIEFGDTIVFEIELYNQGNVGVSFIEVTDYLPAGLAFVNDGSINAGWDGSDANNPVYTWTGTMLAGQADTISLAAIVVQPNVYSADAYTNISEISGATDLGGRDMALLDQDSELNNDSGDNGGGQVESPADDEINGDGTSTTIDDAASSDQDNVDPALVKVVDLALSKIVSPSVDQTLLHYGDLITFEITIENQGNVIMDSVEVKDYIPAGYLFEETLPNNSDWNIDSVGVLTYISKNTLLAGASDVILLDLILNDIDNGATERSWINYAEISEAYDTTGTSVADHDIDSQPQSNGTNENTILPDGPGDDDRSSTSNGGIGSEDDHDPAGVEIFDLALTKTLSSVHNQLSNLNEPMTLEKLMAKMNDGQIINGDTIVFEITIWNQGNVPATRVTIEDYTPCGFSAIPGLGDFDVSGRLTTTDTLAPGMNASYFGYFEILRGSNLPTGCSGNTIYDNYAEIIEAHDNQGNIGDDIDSNPGSDTPTERVIVPGGSGDNDISSTSIDQFGSEDDHDPGNILFFDLALKKELVYEDASYAYGDIAEFVITLYNQGNIAMDSISIVDYVPDGLEFLPAINPHWKDIGDNQIMWDTTMAEGFDPQSFMLGDSLKIALSLRLRPSSLEHAFLNVAEIGGVKDVDGNVLMADNDSRFDHNPNNDSGGAPNTSSDNEVMGTGLDVVGGSDPMGDEDDSDPALISIVDVALIKKIDSSFTALPYSYGDTLKFDITIYNQGNVVLDEIEVTDYLPTGFSFDDQISLNSEWSQEGNLIKRTLTGAQLGMTSDTTISIYLTLQQSSDLNAWENVAEVSRIVNDNGVDVTIRDVDSHLDDSPDNNGGGIANSEADDTNKGDGTAFGPDDDASTDQDNTDPSLVDIFDLALIKQVATESPFNYGDIVRFDITVFNQGNIDAASIEITDHLPDGYSFDHAYHPDNASWIGSPVLGSGDITYTSNSILAAQSHIVIPIYLRLERLTSSTNEKSWINYAEITDAADSKGNRMSSGTLFDADSQEGTDNTQENDVQIGDPGDDDISSTGSAEVGSEDDHDPAGIEVYDAALRKKLTTDVPVQFGDTLRYSIVVFNQGNRSLQDIVIHEYINSGYQWSSENDAIWDLIDAENAQTTITSAIAPGDSAEVFIDLIVRQGTNASELNNYAEISSMNGSHGNPIQDIDSNPDSDNSDGLSDDMLHGENSDEDDHDIAVPPVFDLALRKSIVSNTEGLVLGDPLEYEFLIFNQGNMDATSIEIADFIDSALEFDADLNPDWKEVDGHLEYVSKIDIAAGDSTRVYITLIIREPVILNQSEIIGARNSQGVSMNENDIDSKPDADMSNDVGGLPGSDTDDMVDGNGTKDEDDHDPAFLVICTEIECKAPLNISLDADCKLEVTPDMILKETLYPDSAYTLSYFDMSNSPLDGPIYNDQFKVMVELNIPHCPQSVCWTDLRLEDKIAPSIECVNDTIFCFEMIDYIPPMTNDGCGNTELVLLNQTETKVCNDSIFKRLTRTYAVVDANGNQSESCTQELYIKQFDIADIIFPADMTLACNDPIVEGKDSFDLASFGFPTFNGEPLTNFIGDTCKLAMEYEDMIIRNEPCRKQIMRLWKVFQWRCDREDRREFAQLINVVDTTSPELIVPQDTVKELATRGDCIAEVELPQLTAEDNCDENVTITLSGGHGVVRHDLGEKLELPLGVHTIYVQAYDDCHNITNDSFYVSVIDEAPPTVLCIENSTVSLNGSPSVSVHAEIFDAGSFDACGGSLTFTAARMDDVSLFDSLQNEGIGGTLTEHGEWYVPLSSMEAACGRALTGSGTVDGAAVIYRENLFQKDVHFCCSDVNNNVQIFMQATDKTGRTNTCMTVVEVEDKATPSISCPPNMTVTCGLKLTNMNQFGKVVFEGQQEAISLDEDEIIEASGILVDGVAFGNCLDQIVDESTSELNECGLGTITRKFTVAGNNGRKQSCSQIITVIDDGSAKPDNIRYPEDVEIYECVDRENLSSLDTGFPEIIESRCDLVGFAFKDEVISFSGDGGCFKVLRTWKAFNNCDESKSIIGEHVQSIAIKDSIGPEFVSCSDFPLEFTLLNPCENGEVTVSKSATDNCTAPEQIKWELNVDVNNDGTYDHTFLPEATESNGESKVSMSIPVELQENRIQWVIFDQCGGKTVCEEIVNVRGSVQPEALCITSLTGDLSETVPGDEEIVVWANEFDIGSSTVGCENVVELKYSFDSISDVPSRTFTCDDIGIQNFRVYLLAVDMSTGDVLDHNSCNVEFIVTDQDGSCGVQGNGLFVDGDLESHRGGMISSAEVVLMDDASGNTRSKESNLNGEYIFQDVFAGRDYNVYPVKNDDWLNGVSTLDLILIQNHILGNDRLENGFELIAGDINNDKVISAIDLVLLRKLILGIDTEVKSNKSWRFSLRSQNVGAMSLEDAIQEDYDIISLSEAMNVNWTGIKIGDISGNAIANELAKSESRGAERVDLTYQYRITNGYTIVSFYLPEMEYQGMQVELNIPDGARIKEFALRQLKIKGQDLYIDKSRNLIRLSHALTSEVSIDPNEPIFALILDGDLDKSAKLISDDNWMVSEVYDGQEAIRMDVVKTESEINIIELYQNEPNPWSEKTLIEFSLPSAGDVVVRVIDLNGKELWRHNDEYSAGIHGIELSKNDIPMQGVVIYEVVHDDQILRKKMIHMK